MHIHKTRSSSFLSWLHNFQIYETLFYHSWLNEYIHWPSDLPWRCIVPDSCASSDGTIYTSGGLSAGQKYKYCTGPPSPAKRPPPSSACQCTFPFTYKGKQYSSCTTADDTSPWCMVSSACSNYMGHIGSQKWLYCWNYLLRPGKAGGAIVMKQGRLSLVERNQILLGLNQASLLLRRRMKFISCKQLWMLLTSGNILNDPAD